MNRKDLLAQGWTCFVDAWPPLKDFCGESGYISKQVLIKIISTDESLQETYSNIYIGKLFGNNYKSAEIYYSDWCETFKFDCDSNEDDDLYIGSFYWKELED